MKHVTKVCDKCDKGTVLLPHKGGGDCPRYTLPRQSLLFEKKTFRTVGDAGPYIKTVITRIFRPGFVIASRRRAIPGVSIFVHALPPALVRGVPEGRGEKRMHQLPPVKLPEIGNLPAHS